MAVREVVVVSVVVAAAAGGEAAGARAVEAMMAEKRPEVEKSLQIRQLRLLQV